MRFWAVIISQKRLNISWRKWWHSRDNWKTSFCLVLSEESACSKQSIVIGSILFVLKVTCCPLDTIRWRHDVKQTRNMENRVTWALKCENITSLESSFGVVQFTLLSNSCYLGHWTREVHMVLQVVLRVLLRSWKLDVEKKRICWYCRESLN